VAERDDLLQQKLDTERNANQVQQALADLSTGRGRGNANDVDANKFAYRGQNINAILQEIQRSARKFNRPPIGPVGMYLSLKEDHWALAIEAALGASFGTFLVHSEHDQQELRRCCQRARVGAPFSYVSSFDRSKLQIPRNSLPPREFQTVASVVKINHPDLSHVIWNYLVDQAGIERTVLLEDERAATVAIFDEQRALPSRKGFTADGFVAEVRGRGTQVYRPVLKDWSRPRIEIDGRDEEQDRIRFESLLAEKRSEIRDLETRIRRCTAREKQSASASKRLEREADELTDKAITLDTQVQQKYEELQDALNDAVTGGGTEDLAAQIAETELQIAEKEKFVQSTEQMLSKLGDEIESHKEQIERKQADVEKLRTENEDMVSNAQFLEEELEKAAQDVEIFRKKIEYAKKQVAKLEKHRDEHKPEYDRELALVEETCCSREELSGAVAAVEGVMDRDTPLELENDDDVALVEKLLAKMKANISSLEKECGSLEELELQYLRCEKDYEHKQKMFVKIKGPWELLRGALGERWQKFEAIKAHLQKCANFSFNYLLGKRGHTGTLKFKEEELKMVVRLNGGKGVRDLKSLSGGERSLATLAFMLSLQSETPFRAADEFDVFQDAVNRKVSLLTLLQFAVEHPGTQMLLLTPQDLSAVDEIKEDVIAKHENYNDKFIKLVRIS